MLVWQMLIVAVLILVNGFFAMSELALVSAKRIRLEHMAQAGNRGAAAALKLMEDPTRFLSSVQIGITLVGIFAGAYSGTTFAAPLGELLQEMSVPAHLAADVAFVVVVVAITYFSLIAGELVPKRIALGHAERIAAFAAPPMTLVARAGTPVVWFLRVSTEAVLAILRVKPREDGGVSEEEVKAMIAEGAESGVFVPAERDMINGVLRLADRPVRSIMVPRPDTVWLSLEDEIPAVLEEIVASGHSRFPVSRGDVDDLVGVVHVKDLLALPRPAGVEDIEAVIRQPLYVSESVPVLKLLELFRNSTVHMAVVVDEFGAFDGIVTPNDILTAIAGDLPERAGEEEPDAVQRRDGSWLLDGRMPAERLDRVLGVAIEPDAPYATLAGLMLEHLEHIPVPGESIAWNGWELEVVDLDGRRIDKVLARRLGEPGTTPGPAAPEAT